jgi:stage V sporulation protein G
MRLSEIRIHLCGSRPADHPGNHHQAGRLRAYCSLTFDQTFVIRDVKLVEGNDGLFLAMPARKLCDHCARCGEKNHLRARYCNHCGTQLNENRYLRYQTGPGRLKLHADIAHPINARTRAAIEREVFAAYEAELERARQPGYVPTRIDFDVEDPAEDRPIRLRATGTMAH